MLVNFIGSPASGKTTTAAMLFAALKEKGLAAEFISERAREYIAGEKVSKKTQKPLLRDEDQHNIMYNQWEIEDLMKQSCGQNSVVISDSSPLNSLLYMSPKFRLDERVEEIVNNTLVLMNEKGNLTFVCEPIPQDRRIPDPNRIHDLKEIKKIDSLVAQMIKNLKRGSLPKANWIWLHGNTQKRLTIALEWVYRRLESE